MDDGEHLTINGKKDIEVYCSKRTSKALHMEFPYVFTKKYPGTPSVNINIIDYKPFEINNIRIIPIDVLHYKMQVFGYRINDFVYLTDVSDIPNNEPIKMENADLIILDALRKKEHLSHFNLSQAVDILLKLKPKKALLTHISHYMGLHEKVNKDLPSNISLAYDGQKIII